MSVYYNNYEDEEIGNYLSQLNNNPNEKSDFEIKYGRLPTKGAIGLYLFRKHFGKLENILKEEK
jgi:hypothetical protein